MIKELALSAPKRQGFFPAVIVTEMENMEINNIKVRRSRGWNTYFWGNSDRSPLAVEIYKEKRLGRAREILQAKAQDIIKYGPYHILDMSWTVLLMLRWYEELEQDPRLLEYTLDYAEALTALQQDNGFFPA